MLFNNSKKILGFDDTLYVLGGIFLSTHGAMAIYYPGALFEVDFKLYAFKWLGELVYITLLWLPLRTLYLRLHQRYRGLKNVLTRALILPVFLIPYLLLTLLDQSLK